MVSGVSALQTFQGALAAGMTTAASQAAPQLALAGGQNLAAAPALAPAVSAVAQGVVAASPETMAALSAYILSTGAPGGDAGAPETGLSLPGRAQSRINLSNEGWDHVVNRHFSGKPNASQFTVAQDELRGILQGEEVVKTPITRTLQSTEGTLYVREVDLGRQIGLDKFNNMNPTNVMSVVTDKFGNLKTVTPGIIK
jgi:filamentous hemagglutinin